MTGPVNLNVWQRQFLTWLSANDGAWCRVVIRRSGEQLHMIPVRRQCKRRGFAETHPQLRRVWRITPAGLAALNQEPHNG